MGFAYLNGSLRPHGTNKKIKSHGFYVCTSRNKIKQTNQKYIAFWDLGGNKKVELKTKMLNEKNIFIN